VQYGATIVLHGATTVLLWCYHDATLVCIRCSQSASNENTIVLGYASARSASHSCQPVSEVGHAHTGNGKKAEQRGRMYRRRESPER
jgi:hypothetical protein